jgi:hypothetical protein
MCFAYPKAASNLTGRHGSHWGRYSEKELKDIAADYLRAGYFRGDSKSEPADGDVARRNSIWINKLIIELSRPSLIAVGVGHLYGQGGLIQLLEERGFSVEAAH